MVGRRCLSTAVVDEGCQVADCQSDGELAFDATIGLGTGQILMTYHRATARSRSDY